MEVCDIVEEVVTKTIPKKNNVSAGFRKGGGTKIKLSISTESKTMQKNSRKTFTSVSLTMLKPLIVWIATN